MRLANLGVQSPGASDIGSARFVCAVQIGVNLVDSVEPRDLSIGRDPARVYQHPGSDTYKRDSQVCAARSHNQSLDVFPPSRGACSERDKRVSGRIGPLLPHFRRDGRDENERSAEIFDEPLRQRLSQTLKALATPPGRSAPTTATGFPAGLLTRRPVRLVSVGGFLGCFLRGFVRKVVGWV